MLAGPTARRPAAGSDVERIDLDAGIDSRPASRLLRDHGRPRLGQSILPGRPHEKPTLAEGGNLLLGDVERGGGETQQLDGILGAGPAHDGEGARRRETEGLAPGPLGIGQDRRVACWAACTTS